MMPGVSVGCSVGCVGSHATQVHKEHNIAAAITTCLIGFLLLKRDVTRGD
jgi:hypothetical protein